MGAARIQMLPSNYMKPIFKIEKVQRGAPEEDQDML
jgi:hypothetical protein